MKTPKSNCTKPSCNCLEIAEQKNGGPVKYGYPCLADNKELNDHALSNVLPADSNQEKVAFELEDIEDAKIIIIAKGKHWSIVSDNEKISKEDAKVYRAELTKVLIGMSDFIVVTPALEDIKPEFAKKLVEIKSMGNTAMIAELQKKYERYVSNIEWHIKNNKPIGTDLDECNKQLFCYNEMLTDLKKLSAPKEAINHSDLNEELKGSEIF